MITYKKITLVSAKEYVEYGPMSIPSAARVFPGLYIAPNTKISTIIEVIELDKFGSYDYAVPETWAKENNYPSGFQQAIWFYPKEGPGHLFGEPLKVWEMIAMLRNQIKKELPNFFKWIKENWEDTEL